MSFDATVWTSAKAQDQKFLANQAPRLPPIGGKGQYLFPHRHLTEYDMWRNTQPEKLCFEEIFAPRPLHQKT
ncbi:MAG: hypothetical protein EOM37_02475 [Proteobacteria bacterium]|nr:hypothetical protein [Pseudomonadota bacterium]